MFVQKIAKNEIGVNELEILFSEYLKPLLVFKFAAYCFLKEQQSFWNYP